MHHPTRGGNRGGQDQFDWEDVKADKHRESYLGESKFFVKSNNSNSKYFEPPANSNLFQIPFR